MIRRSDASLMLTQSPITKCDLLCRALPASVTTLDASLVYRTDLLIRADQLRCFERETGRSAQEKVAMKITLSCGLGLRVIDDPRGT